MSDGRNFTRYVPGCELNPPNMSSNQARAYLIQNSLKLIERERAMAERHGCAERTGPCFDFSSSGTALPELSYMSCDKRHCRIVPGVPDGLGMGLKSELDVANRGVSASRM